MQYLKRVLLLFASIGLIFIKINYYPGFKQDFSFYNLVGVVLNILIIGTFVLMFYISININKNPGIIAFEVFISLWLLFFSFYVPIYYLGANPFTDLFVFIMNNLTIVTYAQLLLGAWIISFVRIMFNTSSARRSYSGYHRY